MRSLGSLLTLVLHQAVDLEPVGPPAVPAARLGHADHEALPQPASLASGPVLLVDDTLVVVAALLDHCLVVTAPAEEALAALAGERSKVETSCRLVAHSTLLVRKRIQGSTLLEKHSHVKQRSCVTKDNDKFE